MRKRLLLAVTLLGSSLLSGCASVFEQPYFDWYQEREPSKVPYTLAYMTPENATRACSFICKSIKYCDPLPEARACTWHSQKLIIVPFGAADWIIEHERKHEQGFNHK